MKKRNSTHRWVWTASGVLAILGGVFALNACETARVNGTDETGQGTQEEDQTSGELGPGVGATDSNEVKPNDSDARRLLGAPIPSDQEVDKIIADDSGKGTGVIYVTLNHLGKKAGGPEELEVYRYGVTKAMNSISVRPSINKLEPLDQGETIFRLKLDDFSLKENDLRTILAAPGSQDGAKKVGNKVLVKGDWLVYAVTRPEVYDKVMRIPNAVGQLESQLRLGSKRISAEVGDGQSEVTFGRRVLERMDSGVQGGEPGSYYWRSFDFAGPLVAGEFFFSLPNGLQGYMLSGFATQHRIDAQPFVATDANRPQDGIARCVGGAKGCGFVINGESCITCHENGVKMNKNFGNIKGGTKQEFEQYLKRDAERFASALNKMGYNTVGVEPIKKTLETYRSRSGAVDKRAGGSEVNIVRPEGGLFQR